MTPAEIISDVAARFGVTPDAIVGRERTAWVCKARREVVVELRRLEMGWSDIGRLLGHRNHSTIMYAAGAVHRG